MIPKPSTRASRSWMRRESGFTLLELVIVIFVIGILLSIATTSYLGARERAHRSVAEANVRSIIPPINAYFADHETYATMTLAELKAVYDTAIDPSRYSFGSPGNLTATSFCVQSSAGQETYRKAGPDADIVAGACP